MANAAMANERARLSTQRVCQRRNCHGQARIDQLWWPFWASQCGSDELSRSSSSASLMANYVLIHGAGSDAWYWHLVTPRLEGHGHDVIAVDLPCDDDAAGLDEYTDTVVGAIGDRRHVILVAQSLGGFTAPLVCDRLPDAVDLLVLVAAMVPRAGESPGDWWANTGH